MASSLDSFLSGTNATYVAELYARFLENPNSVDPSWVKFFTELADDLREVLDELNGASWASAESGVIGSNGGMSAEDVAASFDRPAAPGDG
ncbi:MAG: hypothetical protein QGF71_01635, partial [Rhodospirillales bacterium]|nr:hypothetical protein [Rhodospirillales bacterium]